MHQNVKLTAAPLLREDLRHAQDERRTLRMLEGVIREAVCRLHTTDPEQYAEMLGQADEYARQATQFDERIRHLTTQIQSLEMAL